MESANSSALCASLPKRVRLGLGDDTGAPPPCEVLADLFADESDLRLCLCQLGVEEPVPCEMVQALLLLQQQAINPSARRQKRRASMFPEQQALAIQSKCARGGPASGHSGSRLAAEVFRGYPAGIDQVSARHTKGSVASSRAGKEGANALESFAECFSA